MVLLRGRRCRLGSTVGTAARPPGKCLEEKRQKRCRVRFRAALTAAYGRCTMHVSVICPRDSMSLCPAADKRYADKSLLRRWSRARTLQREERAQAPVTAALLTTSPN